MSLHLLCAVLRFSWRRTVGPIVYLKEFWPHNLSGRTFSLFARYYNESASISAQLCPILYQWSTAHDVFPATHSFLRFNCVPYDVHYWTFNAMVLVYDTLCVWACVVYLFACVQHPLHPSSIVCYWRCYRNCRYHITLHYIQLQQRGDISRQLLRLQFNCIRL